MVARKNQFVFDLMLMNAPCRIVRKSKIFFRAMAFNFRDALVSSIGIFPSDGKRKVNPMIRWRQFEFVRPAIPGKNSAVIPCGLAVQLDLGGPPLCHPVLKFHLRAEKTITLP